MKKMSVEKLSLDALYGQASNRILGLRRPRRFKWLINIIQAFVKNLIMFLFRNKSRLRYRLISYTIIGQNNEALSNELFRNLTEKRTISQKLP